VNRIDQETEKEVRAYKGCRAIQEDRPFINTGNLEPRTLTHLLSVTRTVLHSYNNGTCNVHYSADNYKC
jgi:hypothetical protein